jgi:acylphosphatase
LRKEKNKNWILEEEYRVYNTKFVLAEGGDVYPGYFDKEKREEMQKQNCDKRGYMWCGCRSDQKLFYRISEDLKLYPEHNKYQHDQNCCRYRSETGEQERKTGYVVNDEDGEVTAYLTFNPKEMTKKESDEKEQDNPDADTDTEEEAETEAVIEKEESITKKEEKKEPKLTLASLIRSINIDTYAEKTLNDKVVSSRDTFSKFVYFRMKKVKASRMKKPIGELSLETDGVRFIYLPFAGVVQKEERGLKKCYIKTVGADGKEYSNFIFPETLEKLKKDFVKMYGIEPNGDTMLAGFQYYKKSKSGGGYKVLGRIHLFQTSDIGLYCRSLTEKQAFDSICSLAKEDKKLKFWIPADDESVGGIIEVKEKDKKILLLFRTKKAERVTFNPTMYEPLVVGENEPVTRERLDHIIGHME